MKVQIPCGLVWSKLVGLGGMHCVGVLLLRRFTVPGAKSLGETGYKL